MIVAKNELKKLEDSFIKGQEAKERLDTVNRILKENIDKFLSHPPITEGTFDDPIYPIKTKF